MMPADKLLSVAKVLKSNGADGQLVLGIYEMEAGNFLSLTLQNKVPVYIEFDGLPVPFFVEDGTQRGSGKVLVHLTGIRNEKDVEEVLGARIWMEKSLPEDENGDPMEDAALLTGWTLCDKGRPVGRIAGFEDIPGNPCLSVLNGENECLVPFREEFLLGLDERQQRLDMDLPDGLLDL